MSPFLNSVKEEALAKEKFFGIFSTIFKRKNPPGISRKISKAMNLKKEQVLRNGKRLTAVFFDPDARCNGDRCLTDYFFQRVIIVVSQMCDESGVKYYLIEKERALLMEETAEIAEKILARAAEKLKNENTGLQYNIRILI